MIDVYASLTSVSLRIRKQDVSPVQVVTACLKRIEELNPKVNAFITVLGEHALEQARIAESEIKASRWRGWLHGIPVGIKDFYDTAGTRTTAAFEHLKDRIPPQDAAGVARLKEAGAIILGKTNMHRLGMGTTSLESYFGPVRNPWNLDSIAGGSSGGSAAAVASGMCYATLDTDAVGSCRLPAACCGVVGFKGTYGLISTRGILEGEKEPDESIQWLSHAGVTTRSVEDTAHMLDVLADQDRHKSVLSYFDSLATARKHRIGIANNFRADEEVIAAFQRAVETIRAFGYPMIRTTAPFHDIRAGIASIETDRKAIVEQAFCDVDLFVLPTTATTTPMVKTASANPLALSPENTVSANYYGLPAVSVPCGFDRKGLPLGLQIVGKPWEERALLRLAHEYQEATSWNTRHPTFPLPRLKS